MQRDFYLKLRTRPSGQPLQKTFTLKRIWGDSSAQCSSEEMKGTELLASAAAMVLEKSLLISS
jgi:hypothetical protein